MTKAEEILKNVAGLHDIVFSELRYKNCISVKEALDLAKQMCELQKKECAESAMITRQRPNIMFDWTYTVNKDSIINCKNVCDE